MAAISRQRTWCPEENDETTVAEAVVAMDVEVLAVATPRTAVVVDAHKVATSKLASIASSAGKRGMPLSSASKGSMLHLQDLHRSRHLQQQRHTE